MNKEYIDDVLKEFDLKFSTLVAEHEDGTSTRIGVNPEMLDFLQHHINKAYELGKVDMFKKINEWHNRNGYSSGSWVECKIEIASLIGTDCENAEEKLQQAYEQGAKDKAGEMLKYFEANFLDGDKITDCGKTTIVVDEDFIDFFTQRTR